MARLEAAQSSRHTREVLAVFAAQQFEIARFRACFVEKVKLAHNGVAGVREFEAAPQARQRLVGLLHLEVDLAQVKQHERLIGILRVIGKEQLHVPLFRPHVGRYAS